MEPSLFVRGQISPDRLLLGEHGSQRIGIRPDRLITHRRLQLDEPGFEVLDALFQLLHRESLQRR